MSNINVKVTKECNSKYLVELEITKGVTFVIVDDDIFDLDFYRDLLYEMKHYVDDSGGANSNTSIYYDDGFLRIDFGYNAVPTNSLFDIILEYEEGIILLEKIIEGFKNAEFA